MEQDLRSGKLAYLLPRPISYLGAVFAEGLGILCTNLVLWGIVTFGFTYLRIGAAPFNLGAFFVTLLMGLLAGCVGLIFHMLVGLSAFWLHRIAPFYLIWEKLLFTLGGLMLPLAIYPLWLQNLAYLTPFPAILGVRSALAIDFNLAQVLLLTVSLLFWGLLGLTGLFLLYRQGLRIINIEGG